MVSAWKQVAGGRSLSVTRGCTREHRDSERTQVEFLSTDDMEDIGQESVLSSGGSATQEDGLEQSQEDPDLGLSGDMLEDGDVEESPRGAGRRWKDTGQGQRFRGD